MVRARIKGTMKSSFILTKCMGFSCAKIFSGAAVSMVTLDGNAGGPSLAQETPQPKPEVRAFRLSGQEPQPQNGPSQNPTTQNSTPQNPTPQTSTGPNPETQALPAVADPTEAARRAAPPQNGDVLHLTF